MNVVSEKVLNKKPHDLQTTMSNLSGFFARRPIILKQNVNAITNNNAKSEQIFH